MELSPVTDPSPDDWKKLLTGMSLSEQNKLYLEYSHCSRCGKKIDGDKHYVVPKLDAIYCSVCKMTLAKRSNRLIKCGKHYVPYSYRFLFYEDIGKYRKKKQFKDIYAHLPMISFSEEHKKYKVTFDAAEFDHGDDTIIVEWYYDTLQDFADELFEGIKGVTVTVKDRRTEQ